MKARGILAGIIAVALLGAAAAFLARQTPNANAIRVSAVLTLEGDWKPYGEAYERGVRLAIAKLREDGVAVELYRPQSYTGDKEVALQRLRELHEEGGVTMVVGLVSSSAIEHCADYLNNNHMFLLDAAATRSSLGRYRFFMRTIPPDRAAAGEIASWAAQSGSKRGVILSFRDEWSIGLRQDYEAACRKEGLEIATVIELDGSERTPSALRAAADRVVSAKPDFVLLAILGEDAAVVLRFLPTERRPAIYGTDNLIGGFKQLANAAGSGVRFVVQRRSRITDEFSQRFAAAFPEQDMHLFTQTAYDATLAACQAMKAVGEDPEKIRAWLTSNEIADGANGPVRLGEDGPATQPFERREFFMAGGTLSERPAR